MVEIPVGALELALVAQQAEDVRAHADQGLHAAGRPVEATEQLLAARLGGKVQGRRPVVQRLGLPGGERLLKALRIRAELRGQGLEEHQPLVRI